MKKIIILLITVQCSLFSVHCLAQPCLPEGITFTTQEQIDNFQTNHPNCTEIEGDVSFSGNITNLDRLSMLTAIGGNLEIGPSSLTSLAGLENLTSIGGDLIIEDTPRLTDLSGLENLTSIGGDLMIMENSVLTNIMSLNNLNSNSITNLTIFDNNSLSSCEAQGICNYLASPSGSIDIYNNATGCNSPIEIANTCGITLPCLPYGNYYFNSQAEIDSFPAHYPNCTELEGNVTISGNDITNLNGLSNVTSVADSLSIRNTPDLVNLSGLDQLDSIGGNLEIENSGLTSLESLENLTSIGGDLYINGINSLTSLTGLEGLTTIGGSLIIGQDYYYGGNHALSSLAGLEGLISIGGDLLIINNQSLSSCEAQGICDYLASPSGSIDIYNNATGCNSPIEIANTCGITLPCLPYGNYYFNSQAEIDSFPAYYPNCTDLQGDVLINGNDISNLSGLAAVTSVAGTLSIRDNPLLANLSGLEQLNSIGGVDIYANSSLTSISSLNNVTFIGGNLWIQGNNALTSLEGLENVTSIGGDLGIVWFNNSLINLSGLEQLDSIGGDLIIKGNNSLTSLSGLENLASLGGDLHIGYLDGNASWTCTMGNYSLNDISSLSNLTSIAGSLAVICNPSLKSLTGLHNITFVGGGLWIGSNDSLVNLFPQSNLDTIRGDLWLGIPFYWYYPSPSNPCLPDLSGLDSLDYIGGNFYILGHDSLNNLDALANLSFVGVDLLIIDNPVLDNILSLNNLNASSIRNLGISGNSSLSSCEAQGICDYLASPSASIYIHSNAPGCNTPAEIANECGFQMPCLPQGNYYFTSQADVDNFQFHYPGCTELKGSVYISGDDITNLNGLSVITSIDADLFIGDPYGSLGLTGNPLLTNLTGLEGLTSIGGYLRISKNNVLTSLTGLDNVSAGSITNLRIYENSLLSTCEVRSICDYLASPNGTVSIHDNAPGCNSSEEVLESCDTLSVKEIYLADELALFPNPCADAARLRYLIHDIKYLICDLYRIDGRMIRRVIEGEQMPGEHEIEIDMSGLPAGVYFIRLQTGNVVAVRKLIVR